MAVLLYGRLKHRPKTWSGPQWYGPYRPQKWSEEARSGWKSTPLAIHKNEINLAVATTCCAELETAARRCLMHCAAAQLRGNVD